MKHFYIQFAWFVAGLISLLLIALFLVAVYANGHVEPTTPQSVENVAQALRDDAVREEAAIAADTHGGTTPEETLSLYIAALERGENDAAAEYFVLERQAPHKEFLRNLSEPVRVRIIDLLRRTSHASGTYSFAKDAYTIRTPILVDFLRYPTGIWKVVEL